MPPPVTVAGSSQPARLRHIRELDGARGLAALMVFFHHVCFSTVRTSGLGRSVDLLRDVSAYGNTGVDLFFVLSGFLITSILIETRHRESYYLDFYWKRVLRILPLYAICLLLVLTIYPKFWGGVLLSALFVVNFGSYFHIYMVGPFWSLAIEEQFYLVWPRVVRNRSVGQLARWSIAIALASLLIRVVAGYFDHHNYYYTFYRCDGLALGALIACWFEQGIDSAGRRRLGNLVLNSGLLGGALIFACSLYLQPPGHPGLRSASLQTGVTLLAASFIGRLVRDSGSRYLALMRSPILTFFGLISYAFYMLHLFVLEAYDHLRPSPPVGNDLTFFSRLFAVLSISVAAALASRYLIELPALSLRKRVLRSPSPPPITSESLNAI